MQLFKSAYQPQFFLLTQSDHNTMHQQDQHRPRYTTVQALQQLNRLAQLITQHTGNTYQCLVAYVQIYITTQNRSEDFFNSFCEHQIVQKVFALDQGNRDTLKILELFNLILANTNQLNSIVYLFSQQTFHSFLFDRFNIFKQSSQTVEYYVQLVKAIIMKMSSGHSSLIKLFCNNRYSSFPMLYQILYLAINAEQELVKITAQQCLLLLINLLNKKKVGCGYLSEIQMAIFYHQLTLGISDSQKDFEGGLKYLVDLIIALQKNFISLKMLMNAFILNVLFSKIHRICELLEVVRKFSEIMLDCQQFPRALYNKIRLIITRIVCNICFNKLTHSTYLTSIIKISKYQNNPCSLGSLLKEDKTIHSSLMRYFSSRFQKIMPYVQQFDQRDQSESDLNVILDGWIAFNGSSEVNSIKQKKHKSKSGIFSFFNAKASKLQGYLKAVTMSVGMNYNSLKYPLFKLSATIDFSTAIFFVESVLVKQQIKGANPMASFQQYQIHSNENRGRFQLNQYFCGQILLMLEKINKQNADIEMQSQKLTQFESTFVAKLKEYLCSNLSDHLLLIQHDYSIKQLSMLNKLLNGLQVSQSIERKAVQKLLWKQEQIQLQINELAFKTDFKSLINYVLYNEYENLLYRNEITSKQGISRDSLIKKMFKYEFIRELISPSLHSLRTFILNKWTQYVNSGSNAQKMAISKYDRDGRVISIKSNDEIRFNISIQDGKQEFCFDFEEQSIFVALYQEECIYFSEYPQGIHFKTKQECAGFKEEWLKVSGLREEIITKWIVQFFEITHNLLCAAITEKKQESFSFRSELEHKICRSDSSQTDSSV